MKLLVLDGNSILNRAFYGIKLLTTKDGRYTNGIYGFLNMLLKLEEETSPGAVAIAFDRKAPTFRHKAYEGYKAQRKGMPEELAQQLPVLKELLEKLGYRLVECDGFEADDILGTFAEHCRNQPDEECVIATGDRDSLQLVGGGVTVRLAATKMGRPEVTLYDEEKIKEDYGVTPKQLIDIKAIQGDTSDNIPGVAGIGQKGAADLIRRFHDLDHIYENLDTLDIKEGQRKKLREGKDSAYMSRMLGTIVTDAQVDVEPGHYVRKEGDPQGAARLLAKLEMFSLIEKLGLRASAAVPEEEEKEEALLVESRTDYDALLDELERAGCAAFAAQASGEIQALALCFAGKVSLARAEDSLEFPSFVSRLFALPGVSLATFDAKPVFAALPEKPGAGENIRFDALLAAYLLNPSASGYDVRRL